MNNKTEQKIIDHISKSAEAIDKQAQPRTWEEVEKFK